MTKNSLQFRLFQLLVVVSVFGIFISMMVFYSCEWLFAADNEKYSFSLYDYLTTIVSTLLSVIAAFFLSLRFAGKLLPPMSSIASSARQIAEGKLDVRASMGKFKLTELELLVSDFNLMAERLQHMTSEMKTWNATIAHELRTPVTVLRGNLQGITAGVIPLDSRSMTSLSKNVEGLARIIDDLRVVSLAETCQLSIYREYVDLSSELESLAHNFVPQFSCAGKKLRYDLQPIECFVDVLRIKQATGALLHNALNYSAEGVVLITCVKEDGNIVISVEDEGPGIKEEEREKIFGTFYRVAVDKKSEYGSSGLGLSVVKAVAMAHGGKASCVASPLGGVKFILSVAE